MAKLPLSLKPILFGFVYNANMNHPADLSSLFASTQRILADAGQIILGKEHQLRLALTCLLARGHLLIEDMPGVGKTTLAHLLARLHGVNPRRMLDATTREEQRAIFEQELAPVFDSAFTRWLTRQPASLFGLGIPPAQYEALAGDDRMDTVLKARLEKLACGFDLKDNYFAVQAFGRGYAGGEGPLPPYLQGANHALVTDRAERVDVRHVNLADFLSEQPAGSADRYVLLDAQDWMDDAQLNALWAQITRTARPGARVLFRTAGEPSILPGRVDDAVLGRWDYQADASRGFTARDRSAIYGGVHLYVLRDDG